MKKHFKKVLCISLALLMLMLSSCKSGSNEKTPAPTEPADTSPRGEKIDFLTLGGVSIADYRIVTSTGSLQKNAGKTLAAAIESFTGHVLPVGTAEPEAEASVIYVGKGKIKYSALGAYSLEGGDVFIDGSFLGLEKTVKYFVHTVLRLEEEPYPSGESYSFESTSKVDVTNEMITSLKPRKLYIKPSGNDLAEGTEDKPLLTIKGAQARAEELLSYSPASVIYDIDDECYYVGNLSLTGSRFDGAEISKEEQEKMDKIMPGIICWGDSLTQGVGASWPPFTETLEKLIRNNVNPSASVVNRGVGGETSATIVGRSGAIPFVLTEDVTIPAEKSSAAVYFALQGGGYVTPLMQGAGTVDAIICGIKGSLTRNSNGIYTFLRDEAGEEVKAPKGSSVIFAYSEQNLDFIPVIFMGENGGWSSPAELVKQTAAIRDKYEIARGENGKYIVVGIASGSAKDRELLEGAMEAEFGDRYINLREYMSTIAPYEAKLTPDSTDLEKMSAGYTPPCMLLEDGVHFTKKGFELTGKLIYQRMSELGFFE